MSGETFNVPKNSYGGGGARHVVCQVVDRDDPEQSGRLKCRIVGYEDGISDDDLQWHRPMGGVGNAQDGGVGTSLTGATTNSYMIGVLSDGAQLPTLMGSIGKGGKDDGGQGKLDQSGRNSDMPKHARDERTDGGDFSFDGEKYRDKSIFLYARDESPNPWGRKESKDADEDTEKSYSIGKDLYA